MTYRSLAIGFVLDVDLKLYSLSSQRARTLKSAVAIGMILGRRFLSQRSQQLRGFSECSVKGILGQVRKPENRLEKTVPRDYHWTINENSRSKGHRVGGE